MLLLLAASPVFAADLTDTLARYGDVLHSEAVVLKGTTYTHAVVDTGKRIEDIVFADAKCETRSGCLLDTPVVSWMRHTPTDDRSWSTDVYLRDGGSLGDALRFAGAHTVDTRVKGSDAQVQVTWTGPDGALVDLQVFDFTLLTKWSPDLEVAPLSQSTPKGPDSWIGWSPWDDWYLPQFSEPWTPPETMPGEAGACWDLVGADITAVQARLAELRKQDDILEGMPFTGLPGTTLIGAISELEIEAMEANLDAMLAWLAECIDADPPAPDGPETPGDCADAPDDCETIPELDETCLSCDEIVMAGDSISYWDERTGEVVVIGLIDNTCLEWTVDTGEDLNGDGYCDE